MSDMDLPQGWAVTTLDQITRTKSGNSTLIKGKLHKNFRADLFPAYSASGQDVWHTEGEEKGSAIIISAVGARCGKCFRTFSEKWSSIANTHIVKPAVEVIVRDFLWYKINDENYWIKGGTAQPFVKVKSSFERPFLLPPLNEQRRIVAKIEELFSELDKGIENLKTAQAQLKVYRQALLKHAFEGKLTAQWRADNPDKLEPADALLKRIQQERAQRYQQQLAEWEAGGKQGSKPKAPKPLPPLTKEELVELPELPVGWGWIKYGDLCSQVRNGIPAKPEGDSGAPIFRISAVRPMYFDMTDIRHIDNQAGEFDSYYLERGDIVFTRYNGSRQYVGVCAEYRSDERRLFPDKLVQTRISAESVLPSYLEKVLSSGASRRFVESKIRTTAGQSGISGEDIKNIPVPICNTTEQRQIIKELESKLSEADQLDQTLTTSLQQAEALRQSILKKAFSGQLVPQDPHDEPASVLLARIQAERAKPTQKSALAGRRKRSATA